VANSYYLIANVDAKLKTHQFTQRQTVSDDDVAFVCHLGAIHKFLNLNLKLTYLII